MHEKRVINSKSLHLWASAICMVLLFVYFWLTNTVVIDGLENISGLVSPHLVRDFKKVPGIRLQQIPVSKNISRDDFHSWLVQQQTISVDQIFDNICQDSTKEEMQCVPGVVFASPSKKNPDYYYHWIRDGAITINTLVNNHLNEEFDRTLHVILQYVNASKELQHTANPSGDLDDPKLRYLGEPKWHVNNSVFEDVWGRPQNDGPALRSISLINFLNKIHDMDDGNTKHDWIFSDVVLLDLKFILLNWNSTSFDLWEEVNAYHFFTSMVQLKALNMGKAYLEKHHSNGSKIYSDISSCIEKIENFINDGTSGFVDNTKGYIVETPSIIDERSGLDIAVILASVMTHDDEKLDNEAKPFIFDVDNPLILNHLNELIDEMSILYPINHDRLGTNMGVALGRYPEDIYDGLGLSEGNPWFLSTLASSELIFKLIFKTHIAKEPLIIDPTKIKFWTKIISFENLNDSQIMIPYGSLAFNQTMSAVFNYADSFLSKINEHVSDQGSMSEQFNKYHGYMQGADDLTWSYGTFWNAIRWRNNVANIF